MSNNSIRKRRSSTTNSDAGAMVTPETNDSQKKARRAKTDLMSCVTRARGLKPTKFNWAPGIRRVIENPRWKRVGFQENNEEDDLDEESVNSGCSNGDDYLERLRREDFQNEGDDEIEDRSWHPPTPEWQGDELYDLTSDQEVHLQTPPTQVTMTVVPTLAVQELTGEPPLNHDAIKKKFTYIRAVEHAGHSYDRNNLIHESAQAQIRLVLTAHQVTDCHDWQQWDNEKLFTTLLRVFPERAEGLCLKDDLRKIKFEYDLKRGVLSHTARP